MNTIVITGAASGIGAATRERLEDQGHTVIGVDLRGTEIEADLARPEGRALAVREIHRIAPKGIDGCVVGAGIGPHSQPIAPIVAVNYFGSIEVLDGVLDLLAEKAGAAVAICSNSAGITGADDPAVLDAMAADDEERSLELAAGLHGFVAYGASKLALGRAVRRRVAKWGEAGVRLNAVAPGPVATPLMQATLDDPELGPLARALPVPWGEHPVDPGRTAAIIDFLLSPDSIPAHGSVLFADGGTDALLRPDHV
jgi:NAD(P)-dependent dehydrogenase (short-subunit alcohol dehydrogenase family)